MTSNNKESRIEKMIINQSNTNEKRVMLEASFLGDLRADSLDTVELLMAFEEEFKDEIKRDIPESEARTMRTVKDVVDFINQK
jgi:acyl carrier protein